MRYSRMIALILVVMILAACSGSDGTPPVNPPTQQLGLDARPANNTCIAPARPTMSTGVVAEEAFAGSPGFAFTTKFLQAPGDGSRWYVLEKNGAVRVFDVATPAAVSTYIDLTSRVRPNFEGGLLGLAFHPGFPAQPVVFVSYTRNGTSTVMESVVSRLILDDALSPASFQEEVLLVVDQPQENHNGGDIAFGADGSLYFGLGDGGGGGDPLERAEDTRFLLGSMLRIDVVGIAFPTPGYSIPNNNPFAANPKCGAGANALACPEIYAYGLRNPWRWSFDASSGDLWLGDVGQGDWEEINIIERNGDYGWDRCEGDHDFEAAGCPLPGLIGPVHEYAHPSGASRSVTGGFVYRGSAVPALVGRYVFADFVTGEIWALHSDGQGGFVAEDLLDSPNQVSSFALGEDGEMYFSGYGPGGLIYRLAPGGGGMTNTIPDDLAATGCVDPANPTQPAAGLIAYDVIADFWSDNAIKSRYFAIPDSAEIDITAGDFQFPTGSVLLKSFTLNGALIETRLLMRHPDGVWAGYTYEWNDQQTAATRVVGGMTRTVGAQQWIYPSESDCLVCHTQIAGFSLGPETAQLNSDLAYATTGRTANQLATLEGVGVFSAPLPDIPGNLQAYADPQDSAASLEERARAYLHTNCAQCHRPGGPTASDMDLRNDTALIATNVCDVMPQAGDLGITDARLVAPGDAGRSILMQRVNRRDADAMPPLGSNEIDSAGVLLLTDWIDSLTGC